jgi:hypothetical protein
VTDEGQLGQPMDEVEVVNAMRNMGAGVWAFFCELQEQGFTREEALRLVVAYVAGMAGGKVG